jgi:hypothetical protein
MHFFFASARFQRYILFKDYSIRILENDEKLAKNYRKKFYYHRRLRKHLDTKK